MDILAIDHLVLTVTDIDRTVTFYEKLGMRRQIFGDGRVALRFGAQKINLHRRGAEISPHAAHPTPGSADLCFLVADHLDDVLRGLSSTEIAVEEGPVERSGASTRLTSVYVRDPDGNLVELSRPR